MTTFALVHGAWHGAWCWERLAGELQRAGHDAIAVELPADHPRATFSIYADVVVSALDHLHEPVVLVAHSLGGHTAPLVPAQRPVSRIVYVCALLADPGRSFAEQVAEDRDMLLTRYGAGIVGDEQNRTRWVDFDVAREVFYADCDEADARAAFARLRPQAQAGYVERCPLGEHPHVEHTYVLCTEDAIVNPEWSRRVVPERLGVEPVELPGSHSPFLSRPAELAQVLLSD